ncbi:SDR family oxidoreductase [Vibrio alginolyticus]|jgi:NADP-dependent 3-hydroxy acid dehydrogenase YdfG|uniref:Oxidoreductase n=3 Tax=Vibrio harveyi group TaxID=717610 RepID=A0A7Y4B187_VIBAL|nr:MULTISPECIES: SDR family oxidoreductase [Vibrio]MDG2789000.1 SDR family oxidoreductase [Vibrio parahaemolyticus]MDW1808738.1 SDR family oxidoreductase [Vibrio sp. Vb2362]MDW1968473.1 SDR family oxidoreductase [Vibrio sp. 945]MDW2257204.1 SDR family oxidoreductase [Vibrio sp. 1409]NAW54098.1 SDR family NAD(P)-dependent oxidoreductase [Vibrio sp. V41_P2S12T139]NAW94867.1 SDR family NAD(P)-dependent oxidoreductase [Vibrio sp. V42_P2S4T144]QCO88247.1 SDR family oxidoreductase [Vibrio neocaled
MKKLIVITGASSGIGEAIARHFSEQGHALLLLARRVERLEALNLPNTLCEKVDVTDKASFEAAIEKAEALYGPVDALVNNAGVMLLGQIDTQEASEWKRMFDVNVIGLLNGMQSVLAPMKARNSGTIINISSIAGKKTFPDHAAYCGTKFAVHAISENVREEVASSNVRVTTIAPGAVETELLSHTTSQDIKDGYDAWKVDMGGVLAADDIARAVLFAYQQPQGVCVREIALAPTKQQP